jgi:hypothetical protein
MESKIGTIKILTSEFTITDDRVSRIIKNVLKQEGFELEIKPILNKDRFIIGEEFKVFITE